MIPRCVELFPKGVKDGPDDNMSIFLRSLNKETFCVECKFSIKDRYGVEQFTKSFFKKFYADLDFGFLQFLSRKTLFQDKDTLLKDDELTIIGDVRKIFTFLNRV